MNDLVKSVNAALKKPPEMTTLDLHMLKLKITVHIKNSHQLVIIGRWCIILGFGEEEIKITKTTESICR